MMQHVQQSVCTVQPCTLKSFLLVFCCCVLVQYAYVTRRVATGCTQKLLALLAQSQLCMLDSDSSERFVSH
jgi:hypothetical protein